MFLDYLLLYFVFFVVALAYYANFFKVCFYFFLVNVLLSFFLFSGSFILNGLFAFYVSFLWVLVVLYFGVVIKKRETAFTFLVTALFIYVGGLLLITNSNVYSLVIGFELMLLSSILLLKVTAKTERSLEAITEMFV